MKKKNGHPKGQRNGKRFVCACRNCGRAFAATRGDAQACGPACQRANSKRNKTGYPHPFKPSSVGYSSEAAALSALESLAGMIRIA